MTIYNNHNSNKVDPNSRTDHTDLNDKNENLDIGSGKGPKAQKTTKFPTPRGVKERLINVFQKMAAGNAKKVLAEATASNRDKPIGLTQLRFNEIKAHMKGIFSKIKSQLEGSREKINNDLRNAREVYQTVWSALEKKGLLENSKVSSAMDKLGIAIDTLDRIMNPANDGKRAELKAAVKNMLTAMKKANVAIKSTSKELKEDYFGRFGKMLKQDFSKLGKDIQKFLKAQSSGFKEGIGEGMKLFAKMLVAEIKGKFRSSKTDASNNEKPKLGERIKSSLQHMSEVIKGKATAAKGRMQSLKHALAEHAKNRGQIIKEQHTKNVAKMKNMHASNVEKMKADREKTKIALQNFGKQLKALFSSIPEKIKLNKNNKKVETNRSTKDVGTQTTAADTQNSEVDVEDFMKRYNDFLDRVISQGASDKEVSDTVSRTIDRASKTSNDQ